MIVTLFLLVIPMLLFWDYTYRKKKNDISYNIPGPPAYPIIGNLFNIQIRSVEEAIENMKSLVQKHGRLVRTWVLNQMVIITADPKTLEIVLTSQKYIKKNTIYSFLDDWLGEGLLLSTGKKWFQRRKIITPTFHFKILEDFVEVFDRQSAIMVERLKEHSGKGVFDINPYVTLSALDIISETSLGTEINAQSNPDCEYARAVYTMSDIFTMRILKPYLRNKLALKYLAPKVQKKQDEAVKILHDFTENIIEERRQLLIKNKTGDNEAPTDDVGRKRKMALLDVLLQSTIDGKPLTNDDIREEVDTFTFEGHDTTTAGIGFTLHCLSRHPEVQKKVFEEIREVIGDDKSKPVTLQELSELKYLDLVIKESLRLYPPVPIIGRLLEEDLHIDDKVIPAGADLTIPLFIILKDPEAFENPEKFDPERFSVESNAEKKNPFAYIPFSAGPRNCIGQKFAMLELKSSITKVLRHFELLPLGENPKAIVNLVLRSSNGVQLGIKDRVYT